MITLREFRSYLGELVGGHPFYNTKVKEALDRRSDVFISIYEENDKLEKRIKELESLPSFIPITTAEAVGHILKELKKDKSPGSFYDAYHANISMSFYDECLKQKVKISQKSGIKLINAAATRFLDLWISQVK
jgi:hypothetical protein